MFRRTLASLSKPLLRTQQTSFRNVRFYSTEAAETVQNQAPKKRKWWRYLIVAYACFFTFPAYYEVYWKGRTVDDIIADLAQKSRMVKFMIEERKKEVMTGEPKQNYFVLRDKFFKREKYDSLDLRTFPKFSASNKSLLKKHLDKETFDALKKEKTSNGFRLDSVIRAGVFAPRPEIGAYAPDVESYTVFAKLLNPIIADYHNGYDVVSGNSPQDFDPSHLKRIVVDKDGNHVLSTRFEVSRNLDGYPLPPGLTKDMKKEIEKKISGSLLSLRGEFDGKYFPYKSMSAEERAVGAMNRNSFYGHGDKELEINGITNDFPHGRGVFGTENSNFWVFVNEEDMMKVISTSSGGDVNKPFERLSTAMGSLSKALNFQHDKSLGYISSNPANLGTSLKASMQVRLPFASKHPDFKKFCEENGLAAKRTEPIHYPAKLGPVFDVYNKARLGVTEVQCVETTAKGVEKLVQWDKELAAQFQQNKERFFAQAAEQAEAEKQHL